MDQAVRQPAPPAARRGLWSFHGGLHLPDHKRESTGGPVCSAAVPARLWLPLQQHIGEPAQPVVSVGDTVLKGQLLARPKGPISAGIHAPTSGTVVAIGPHPIPHPSGLSAPCIELASDGRDAWAELPEPWPDFEARDPAELRERVRWAGIVGLGGAAFPSNVKLSPKADQPIHTLVLNGAECEPYITCDDMLMREHADRVVEGARVLRHVVGADTVLIGIEDNKPEAIAAMQQAVTAAGDARIAVVVIPTKYPSGGEKQLIRVLTGAEVPSHGIPAQIGIVCQNVATAAAVADAVVRGRPLISRIVTLTGEGVARPCNLDVLIGTPARELIAQAGGYTPRVAKLILGGPMMGFALPHDDVPITKAANCLLAPSRAESPTPPAPLPCIRCGRCAEACPVGLLPQQMYWWARAKDLDKTQDYNLFDCIECGCCAHVCPSHIPLVQYYRYAKTEAWAKEQEKRKAEQARQRHEQRVARLERLEAERKAKLRKKKEELETPPAEAPGEDPKTAAIQAALARAAAKKAALAAQGVAPKNTEELTPAQQRQVEAADARRRAAGAPADEEAEK
jgi:Na+-translocating ferredoxin:NAD+ oxidoreductase subunit C